jgi:hypothetical protein
LATDGNFSLAMRRCWRIYGEPTGRTGESGANVIDLKAATTNQLKTEAQKPGVTPETLLSAVKAAARDER